MRLAGMTSDAGRADHGPVRPEAVGRPMNRDFAGRINLANQATWHVTPSTGSGSVWIHESQKKKICLNSFIGFF
jgi:hypothetical protein